MADPINHSFMFGKVDVGVSYGIVIEDVQDALSPPLRERKIIIPQRHGAHDYGAMYYDERVLTLVCASAALLTRAAARELSYTLSRKNTIKLWEEPDKVYRGRIYNPSEIERMVRHFRKFTLEFICEPFAYGATVTSQMTSGRLSVSYAGSVATPTRIEIHNTGLTDAAQLRIRVRERRT